MPVKPGPLLKIDKELDKRTVIQPSLIPGSGNGLFAVVKIKKGEVIVVCGPSGSGKSTLIKCVNALEPFQKGDVVVDGIQAAERTSGNVPFAGTIYTNSTTVGPWQNIINSNPGQASAVTGQTALVASLESDLATAFTQIDGLSATAGYTSVAATALNGLNTLDGINRTYVINVTSGFSISSKINITGDAGDVFVLRWDTNANAADGYQGQVKFQSGGAIVPLGGLTAANFIHVAGDINASGGGSNPTGNFPQGPRLDDGQGALIDGGSDFNGGGFFTGYWLTTGNSKGETASLSNAIFTGGWYTLSSKFSMTSGTSGVHVCANVATLASNAPVNLPFDPNNIGLDANTGSGPTAQVGDTLVYTFSLKNTSATAQNINALIDNNGTSSSADDFTPTAVWKTVSGQQYNYGDVNNNGVFNAGETWFYQTSKIAGAAGLLINGATATTGNASGTTSDTDLANVTVVAASQKASIGNFVWEDANANGVQDAGEKGIAGVTVKLLNSGGSVLASVITDVDGQYAFGNLTPASYKIQIVTPGGYAVTKKDQGSNDGIDSDIDSTGTTVTTTLVAGQNDMRWDAGLYRKASVGDKVWEDKNHNGLQDVGEPGIGNIVVKLLAANGTTVLASTTTNASGNYLFSNLDPGTYVLQFDKSNVIYAGINMNSWKWGVKNVGSNTAIDSDVAGDGVALTNVTKTDAFTLVSGQNDMTRDATITPLVINLDGKGIHTSSLADSTGSFDLFGNGKAVASGWINSGSGFLAVDSNGNGKIDNISELFGGTAKGAGFAQLAAFDSNGDGMVDSQDARFSELKIWVDANGNHQTDDGELMSLADAGVAALQVSYINLPFVDASNNLHLERSLATMADGRSVSMTDVYFNVSSEDAAAAGVALPTLADLLGDDRSLDTVLGADGGMAAPAAMAAPSCQAGHASCDSSEALRRLAALARDEGHALTAY